VTIVKKANEKTIKQIPKLNLTLITN